MVAPQHTPKAFDLYLTQWSTLHGNALPTFVIRAWLRLAFWTSTPFLRMTPNAISLCGAVISFGAIFLTPQHNVVAGCVIFIVGLIDSIDGVVATRTNRISVRGAFVDALVDRWVDVAIGLILVRIGAPILLVFTGLVLTLVLEYMRARAQGLGVDEVGVISVAEKPTRIMIGTLVLIFDGASMPIAFHDADWASLGATAWVVLAAIGAIQVFAAMRSRLK